MIPKNSRRHGKRTLKDQIERHWYHFVLDNQYGNGLKDLLYLKGDERTVVINAPFYLES